ncbi:MAG: tetratricopeptide repeat protein [Chloroflexi bacterium]|nr:tetratricopeptide repeat protein [Chloroflexota bacterium]
MTAHDQLAEARELIKNKQYDAARALLEALPFDETAQKWLAKLDEIAPRPKNNNPFDDFAADPFASSQSYGGFSAFMSAEEKFERVKVLIKNKNFDEARSILKTLPDDASAQALLARLEDLTSGQKTSSTQNPFNPPPKTDGPFGQKTTSRPQRSSGKRPKTMVDYVLSAVGSIVVLIIFIFGRQYVRYGDFNVLRSDQDFENEVMTFTHDWDWKQIDPDEAEWCDNVDDNVNCFAYLARRTSVGDPYGAWIGFAEFELTANSSLSTEQRAANAWASYLEEYPDIQPRTQYTTLVDGVTAVVYEFNYGDGYFEKRLYLHRDPAHFLVIAISASTESGYQRRQGEIEEILASIDLKTS